MYFHIHDFYAMFKKYVFSIMIGKPGELVKWIDILNIFIFN